MGYVNEIFSRYTDEKTFLKTFIHKIVDNSDGKVTCNRSDSEIDTAFETERPANIEFSIYSGLCKIIFTFTSNDLSTIAQSLRYYCAITTPEATLMNNVQMTPFIPSDNYNATANTTMRRLFYSLKVVNGQHWIFIQINGVGLFVYHSDLQDAISYKSLSSTSYTNISPFTEGFKSRFTGETGWTDCYKRDKLTYSYDTANQSNLEIINNKTLYMTFTNQTVPIRRTSLDEVFDCSYCSNLHSVLVLGGDRYFVIDNYSLLKMYDLPAQSNS